MWLPSNLTPGLFSTEAFTNLIRNHPSTTVSTLFIGPGAQEGRIVASADAEGYGDVNNHWVLEMQEDEEFRRDLQATPRVNFMRSLVPWTGDSQTFFNGLMRSFDVDICMMFVGLMPADRDIRHVIVPQHLANRAIQRVGRGAQMSHHLQLNMLYWNQMRLNTTAPARIRARLDKMYDKYNLQRLYTPEEFSARNLVIPTESIEATPISLYRFMNMIRRSVYCQPAFRNLSEPVVPQAVVMPVMPVAGPMQNNDGLHHTFGVAMARASLFNEMITQGQMTAQAAAMAYLTTGTGS